jgi:hypothetical protein
MRPVERGGARKSKPKNRAGRVSGAARESSQPQGKFKPILTINQEQGSGLDNELPRKCYIKDRYPPYPLAGRERSRPQGRLQSFWPYRSSH